MSTLKTQVRIKCKRCGKYFTLKSLQTAQPDPDKKLLQALVKQITKRGMCQNCWNRHNYAAKQKLKGIKTDYNQNVMTVGIRLPGGPTRVTCEFCGRGSHPYRDTCRYCKKPLPPRRLYNARGKVIFEDK